MDRELSNTDQARQLYEHKRRDLATGLGADLVTVTLAQAYFEEHQKQAANARALYEDLATRVAPNHLKVTLDFIAFEMRMSNSDKVKDLFGRALDKALSRVDGPQVTQLSMKFARFLAFKCGDVPAACQVMERATAAIKSSKVLYLSQLNLLRHLEGLGQLPSSPKAAGSRVISTFERALFQSDLQPAEKSAVATSFLDYVQENALSVAQIKAAEAKLAEGGISVARP